MKRKTFKKDLIPLIIFSTLALFSIIMIGTQIPTSRDIKVIGAAATSSTISNVTISKYLSIDMTTNLSTGVFFGNISTLPAVNLNSSHNYDGGSSSTTMAVNVSLDSNTNVDFCIKANQDMIDSSGGNTLNIGNETYANATTTSSTVPDLTKEIKLNKTDYIKAGESVAQGSEVYFRFWLDVPSGQASGTYNNTINFKGVETTAACGS